MINLAKYDNDEAQDSGHGPERPHRNLCSPNNVRTLTIFAARMDKSGYHRNGRWSNLAISDKEI